MKKEVIRMCVVCRERKPKEELIRIVFDSDDFSSYIIDAVKADGRGAYICRCRQCIDRCIKQKALNRVFRRNLPYGVYGDLSKVEVNG